MALACVQEEKLFRLMKMYGNSFSPESSLVKHVRYAIATILMSCALNLCLFSLHPEESFLALRLFTRYMHECYKFDASEILLEELDEIIRLSPSFIEWEEVDKIFEYWLASAVRQGRNTQREPIWRISR